MFKIGDFSNLTHVSIRMLRYYDEIDLFKPIEVDHFTSYRYYSASQISKLNTIVSLKYLGFNLSEIQAILNEEDKEKHITFLKDKEKEISGLVKTEKARLSNLKNYIKNYNKESIKMKYDVVVKEVPSIKVLALRKIIPSYHSEGELWGEYMGKVYKNNIQIKGTCYAEFFEEEYKEKDVDIEIAHEVAVFGENVDGLVFKETTPIKQAATLLVAGDYSPNIAQAFEYIATWLEDNKYNIVGTSRTYYIKGPGEEKNPENYLTELVIPIGK